MLHPQCKVSVIIPVYNAQACLADCLDSVLGQTLEQIEVLCVDDGSTDGSAAILDRYAQVDSRVWVLHQQNAGAGAARNAALPLAQGEYLSILDCDDFFEPDMLEKSYARAKQTDADMVVFGCDFYDDQSRTYLPCDYSIRGTLLPKKEVFSAWDVKRDVFKLFVGWAWDKLFRTDFIRRYSLTFQEQRTTNDMLFVFSALVLAGRITVMPGQILAHHRRGLESLSVTREKSWMCFYNALTALRQTLRDHGCYERFEQDFKNYCVHFSLWNLNTLSEPTRTLLYNKLREEWFAELGLLEHPQPYFYNAYEYNSFRKVYEQPLEGASEEGYDTPSMFTRLRQCCADHGLLYTIKYTIAKVWRRTFSR